MDHFGYIQGKIKVWKAQLNVVHSNVSVEFNQEIERYIIVELNEQLTRLKSVEIRM